MKKQYIVLLIIVIIAAFLRLYKLDQNPPSLYWDEASLGYNAFAILKTGHDEHGERFPIARFIAYGDYKPPGYIYAIVPFMAVFGVNEFSIRFPSALSGVIMVLATYFFIERLTKNKTIGLIAAGLLAISPWSLQLSRAAFEAHLAALFHLVAVMAFLGGLRKKWLLPISAVFFVLSFYTFNSNRILVPLFVGLLGIIYWKDVIASKKWIIVSALVGFILLLPTIPYLQTRESKLRFQEVSIFTSLNTIKKANERIAQSGSSWWAKIIHNRRVYFARDFLSHYLDHFKAEFLFISGDRNPRLSTQDVGELYVFELPLLVVGLGVLLKRRSKLSALLLGWLLLVPIPAGVARETPHMLRTASMLPIYQCIAALGAVTIWQYVQKQKMFIRYGALGIFILLVSGSLLYYFHNYWVHYPREWNGEWQYGYKQMVEKVRELETEYDRISVTQNLGRPYIYFLFYNQVDPLQYAKNRVANRDWYGLWNVDGFDKYDFKEAPQREGERVLKVGTAGTFSDPLKKITEINAPDGQVVFEIGEP